MFIVTLVREEKEVEESEEREVNTERSRAQGR